MISGGNRLRKTVAVHGLKLEIRNLGEMKRIYDLYDYKQAKALEEKCYLS